MTVPHAPAGHIVRCAVLLCLLAVAPRPLSAEPVTYDIDPEHLSVGFLVHHIGFAKVMGMFRAGKGSFVFDEERRTVEDITITVPAASVFTNHDARDDHLRGPDFLWVRKYPDISFVGTRAEPTGERTGVITGALTLRGVTREVSLDVVWNRTGAYPFGSRHVAIGLSARGTLRRSEFGMTYAVANGWVGDEVELIIEFEARRRD